ncbi:hypothetical protein KJ766_01135 [Patescibacteria group bacterium]|nr:hypothetical protein [Patescibacteria group bacterium]
MNKYPILTKLGLSESEARIYSLLLESGRVKARDLVSTSGLGRGNVYNVLESLKQKNLILAIEGAQQQFEAVDPSHLNTLLIEKEQGIELLKAELSATIPQLASVFHLSTGRPVVEVFEGAEGMARALDDTLVSGEEILAYISIPLIGDLQEINNLYVTQRKKKGIVKRVLAPNTEAMKQAAPNSDDITQVRFMTQLQNDLYTTVQIYSGSLLYISQKNEKLISVIIRDEPLYNFQKQLFEHLWRSTN